MRSGSERGVSSVIAVVLMVAVTIVLSVAVGAFVFSITESQQEPAPQVANADATLVADVAGGTDQTVRITHRGGDTVNVSDMEVVVSFADHPEHSRLVGAPTAMIDADDYEGDDIWDGRYGGIGGALASNEPEGSDGEWSSGEALEFRIANRYVSLDPGDTVTVTVVHEPSGSVILERTLTAKSNAFAPHPAARDTAAFAADAPIALGDYQSPARGASRRHATWPNRFWAGTEMA